MPAAPLHAIAGADTPLSVLAGVGPALREKLAARGLSTLQDLWLHLPREYEDRTALTAIRDLRPGVAAQVEGRVEAVERGFRYRPMLRVALSDAGRGTLVLRFFHFRAQQVAQFAVGARVRAYGTPRPGQLGLEIVHPSYRVLDDGEHALGEALDPVYPAIEGIGPASLRKLVLQALQRVSVARGREIGERVHGALGARPSRAACLDGISAALGVLGYEPRPEGDVVELANCPFHALAQQHTVLVCGMNLAFISAAVERIGHPRIRAQLQPEDGRCCVVLTD